MHQLRVLAIRTFLVNHKTHQTEISIIMPQANNSELNSVLDLFSPDAIAGYQKTVNRLYRSLVKASRSGNVISNPDVKAHTVLSGSEIPEGNSSFEQYVDKLVRALIPYGVNFHSVGCLGNMSSAVPAFLPALAASMLTLNQNLVKQESSGAFTLLERYTLAILHRLVFGFPSDYYSDLSKNSSATHGFFVTGATLGNVASLLVARNACFPSSPEFAGIGRAGLPKALDAYGFRGAVIIGSELMHYSVDKAAVLLGIGEDAVVRVSVDAKHRVIPREVERALNRCRAARLCPIAIVAVAGSTDSGSIDDIRALASIASSGKVHLHVDAAWTGPLLCSQRYRSKLQGIEAADSVVLDGHKQFYLPIGTSTVLLRDRLLARVIEQQAPYMLRPDSSDLGMHSLEGSRPAASLYFHSALNILGRRGYEMLINASIEKTKNLARVLRSRPQFQLLIPPQTNILLYRYIGNGQNRKYSMHSVEEIKRLDCLNKKIQSIQAARGRSLVSRTSVIVPPLLSGRPIVALRAIINNPRMELSDFIDALDEQAEIGTMLEGKS